MNRRVALCLFLFIFLVGCNKEIQDSEAITESVEASDFILKVTTPTVMENGETLNVKGMLKYTGDKAVRVFHGEPIIRYSFSGSEEGRMYEDKGFYTTFKPGQTIEINEYFTVTKTGKHKLSTRTTSLEVNGKSIEGVGNEKYIKGNMNERIIELEKSKLTINPIEIQVK